MTNRSRDTPRQGLPSRVEKQTPSVCGEAHLRRALLHDIRCISSALPSEDPRQARLCVRVKGAATEPGAVALEDLRFVNASLFASSLDAVPTDRLELPG